MRLLEMKTLAHEWLDIEREEGFEVPQLCYDTLDALLKKAEEEIDIDDHPVIIMDDMCRILRDSDFKPGNNGLLSHLLQDKVMDCKGSILLYSILDHLYQSKGKDSPFHLVSAPGHVFLRYQMGYHLNFELFDFPGKIKCNAKRDSYYKRSFDIHKTSIDNGVYLRNLKKEEIKSIIYDSIALNAGDFDAAVSAINKSVELSPDNPQNYFNRANIKHKRNRAEGKCTEAKLKEILADLNKAIKLNPNFVKAYYMRASLKRSLRDLEGALGDFKKAKEIYQNCPGAYEEHVPPDFISDCDFWISGLAGDFSVRADSRFKIGDLDGALADYTKSMELFPDAIGYFNCGQIRIMKKKYHRAEYDFTKSLRHGLAEFKGVVHPDFFYASGVSCKKEGDFNAAKVYLNIAVKKDPGNAKTYRERAELHWKNRNLLNWFLDRMKARKVAKYDDNKKDTVVLDVNEIKREAEKLGYKGK